MSFSKGMFIGIIFKWHAENFFKGATAKISATEKLQRKSTTQNLKQPFLFDFIEIDIRHLAALVCTYHNINCFFAYHE